MSNLAYVCLKGFWLGNNKFRKGDPFNLRLVTETQCQEMERDGKIAKASADYDGPAPETTPTRRLPANVQEALKGEAEPTSTRVSAARDPRNQNTSESINKGNADMGEANHNVPNDGTAQQVAKDAEKSDSVTDASKKAEGAKPAAPARPAIQREEATPARRPNRPGSPSK